MVEEEEEEDDDIEEGELLEMFTEVFSILLLKKRKKHLKLNNLDTDASLPHPSNLLKKSGKYKKRDIK